MTELTQEEAHRQVLEHDRKLFKKLTAETTKYYWIEGELYYQLKDNPKIHRILHQVPERVVVRASRYRPYRDGTIRLHAHARITLSLSRDLGDWGTKYHTLPKHAHPRDRLDAIESITINRITMTTGSTYRVGGQYLWEQGICDWCTPHEELRSWLRHYLKTQPPNPK